MIKAISLLLLSLIWLCYCQVDLLDENTIPVFQPFPSAIINPLKACKEGQTSYIKPFSVNSRNYVALSVSICGINIYDITNINQINTVFQERFNPLSKTLMISFSHSNTYLWVGLSTGEFFGINISRLPFSIEVRNQSSNKLLVNTVYSTPFNSDIIFLLCAQELQIYDWRQKDSGFKFIKSVNMNAIKVTQIELIKQNQFALVTAPNKGVQFYSVQINNLDISDITLTYLCLIKPHPNYDVNNFNIIDESTIAIMMNYRGLYMYSLKNFLANNGNPCTAASFTLVSQQSNIVGQGGQSFISLNKKFIYTGMRVQGIKIFDISKKTFQIVQSIQDEENARDIILNDNEDLLFFTNSYTLQIFKRTPPNFNRNIPNLLLNTFQKDQYDWVKDGTGAHTDYDCIWQESKKLFFLIKSIYGISVMKYSGSGILEPRSYVYRPASSSYSNKLTFLEDGVTAYLTRSQLGLSIIDFSNPDTPSILNEKIFFNQQFANFSFIKFIKEFKIGLIANQINLLIIDTSNPANPTLLNTFNSFDYTLGDTTLNKFEVSQDENQLFIVHNNYGIAIVDITDLMNPVFKSKLFTDGASDIKLILNNQYVLISANYKGLIIAKIEKDSSLSVISETKLFGISYRLILMNNDRHVIVTSYENPTVTLVSLENIYKPEVMQKIQKSNAFGYFFMCLSQDNSELFVTSLYSLYRFQLRSQMIIHTQIYELISKENSNEYLRFIVEKGISLKVGQQIEIHLVPIYQSKDILVTNAFYYQDYVQVNLPSWMSFSPNDRILTLNISKQSLKKDKDGNYLETIQQIVFLTYQQVSNNAFVQTYLGIDSADSVTLFNACVKEGYINQLGFVDQTYSPNNEINLGFNEGTYLSKWTGFTQTLVKNYIKYVINMNIINYTISFKTVNSLKIDLDNKDQIINSIINEATLTLKISKTQPQNIVDNLSLINPKFVKLNYSGVLVLFSEKQDEIKIEGNINNINKILSSGIRFYIDQNIPNVSNLQIDIVISDSINFDYERTLPLSDMHFLSKKLQIQLSKKQNLQQEVNDRYPEGQLYIQENFYYQVGEDLFLSNEGDKLDYSVKMFKEGEFKDIPKNFWLSFSSTDRIFSGIPTPKSFYEKVLIQVNATDGYTYMIDTFEIIPVFIPFSYVIQLAIQILGPIIGILSFYKYKYLLFNILNRKHYTYSPDIVYVGEVYKKQITITDNVRPIAQKLWIYFLHKVGQTCIKNQLFSEVNRSDQVTSYSFFSQSYYKSSLTIADSKVIEEELKFPQEIKKKMYPFTLYPDSIKKITHFKRLSSSMLKSVEFESKEILNSSNATPRNDQRDQFINQSKYTDNYQYDTVKQDNVVTESIKEKNSKPIKLVRSANTSNIKYIKNILNGLKNNYKIVFQNQLENIPQLNKSSSLSPLKLSRKQTIAQGPPPVIIFKQNGQINFEQILQFLREQQSQLPPQKRIVNEDDLQELANQHSLLSQAFYCFLIEYLVNEEVIVKNLLDWMQQKATKYYNKIDWYKAFLNIDPQFQDIKTNHYSQFTINQNTLSSCLKDIFQTMGKYYYFPVTRIPKPINISLKLLEEAIKIKAVGFSSKPPGYLKVTQGESFHCYQYQINSIKSYEKNYNVNCCVNLHKRLDLDYKQKSLSDNERLPSWIHSIDLINGIILLKGVPETKDIGNIVFKIIDHNHYVLRQFEIIIMEKETEVDQSKQNNQILNEIVSFEQGQNIEGLSGKKNATRIKQSSFAQRDFYNSANQLRRTRSGMASFYSQKLANEIQLESYENCLEDQIADEDKLSNIIKNISNFDYYSKGNQVKKNETHIQSNNNEAE